MRRMLQVFALLLAVLAGSLPGLSLPGPARPEPCRCGMPMDTCPMKMPVRAPSPGNPCNAGATAPGFILAAPVRLAQAPRAELSREPSPFPRATFVSAVQLLAAGPSVLPRPGPVPPVQPCPSLAMLSVFRI